VGPSQILEYVTTLYGGKQNFPFKKQDMINLIAAKNRKLIGVDVNTTLLYFKKKQEEDPKFFYAIEPDEIGAVKNIFWVDGRGRKAFQEFSDVVTFDMTYQTNKYCMSLAPFIGTSLYRHSIFFGIALLRQELTQNFVGCSKHC
jgi:hypothetical protein